MRQFGWAALAALLLMVACGPPTVTDIGDGGTGVGDDDDGGDDDDATSSTPVTGTPPPSGIPVATLTNVPSYATWNAQIRGITSCAQTCHSGSSGFFTYSTANADGLRSSWFSAICNRSDITPAGGGLPPGGLQDYTPPTGRFRQYMSNNTLADGDPHPAININAGNLATIDAWLNAATANPPNCLDYYDLPASIAGE